MNNGHKFSVCLMNPPYESTLHLKFLDKVLDLCNIVCTIQPSLWLFGGNSKSNAKNNIDNIKNIINDSNVNISVVNKQSFDANIPQELSIIYINQISNNKNISIQGYGDDYIITNINDIKKYGNNKNLIELEEKLSIIANIDNFHNHIIYGPRCHGHLGTKQNELRIVDNEDKNSIILPLPTIRGNIGKDDFYTTIDPNCKVVYYKDFKDGKGHTTPWQYIKCDNFKYGENILKYLKTDFCRICEYFVKLDTGLPIKSLPWFDFSDPHFSKSPKEIDDWLFKKYDISDEIRKHIEEILPDYYGIRK